MTAISTPAIVVSAEQRKRARSIGITYLVLAAGSPLWWLALVGPVLMYLFLRYVSGIPYTEQQALRSRGDDYREYQRTTPMLFPWFPKPATKEATR